MNDDLYLFIFTGESPGLTPYFRLVALIKAPPGEDAYHGDLYARLSEMYQQRGVNIQGLWLRIPDASVLTSRAQTLEEYKKSEGW